MSYNGAGVFQINSAGQPVVTGTTISSTAFNALTADLATGLSTAVLKDGTQTPTANIPLAGFKLTGLGAATVNGDALRFEQLFTAAAWGAPNGTVNLPAITYASDPDTGLYRIGANNIGVAANGAKVLDIGTTGLVVTGASQATGTLNAVSTTSAAAGGLLCVALSSTGVGIYVGSGAPSISAVQGSIYLRTDGGANTRIYSNNNGSTGWSAMTG